MPQPAAPDDTVGVLVHRLTEQIPGLIKSELRLAQVELREKGKRAGAGLGLFSVSGLLAYLGLATLVAAAVLGLALVIAAWLAALIVAALLLIAAGIIALVGRHEVQTATPATPSRTMANVREDVAALRGDLE